MAIILVSGAGAIALIAAQLLEYALNSALLHVAPRHAMLAE
jgi:hypothetical protein